MIDYDLINEALVYYKQLGYQQLEVPWLVSPEANQTTLPTGKDLGQLIEGRCLIGSAEQGFISLVQQDSSIIEKDTKYVSVSPCFRLYDNFDEYHKETFMKVELSYITNDKSVAKAQYKEMMYHAKSLFEQLTNARVLIDPIDDNQEDLIILVNDEPIEVGSYGIRELSDVYTVYGTGIALPRLSKVIDHSNFGYHQKGIVKYEYQSPMKIREELIEFLDAVEQQDKILMTCELSDLITAVDDFASKNLNLSIEDLYRFGQKTSKAFKSGKR